MNSLVTLPGASLGASAAVQRWQISEAPRDMHTSLQWAWLATPWLCLPTCGDLALFPLHSAWAALGAESEWRAKEDGWPVQLPREPCVAGLDRAA